MLVEDHINYRENLSLLLNSNEDFDCVCYSTAEEALEQITDDRPDVILMDFKLPGMSGIECTRVIKERFPDIPIVMCPALKDYEKILESLKAGASGYILKRSTIEEIFDAIKTVASSKKTKL